MKHKNPKKTTKQNKENTVNKFLIFQEMELSSFSLKKFLIFKEVIGKAQKTNKSAPKKFLVSCDVFIIFTAVKHREIPCAYVI